MAHSKFSASASHRWLNCPASVSLSEGLPPPPESPYAKEGTDAHSCLEVFLKTGKAKVKQARKFLSKKFPEEMVKHAEDAAKIIFSEMSDGDALLCETKVSLDFINETMFGTVDAAVIEPFGRLKVFDFKYGAGIIVDPKDNPQLIYYGLGLAHAHDYDFKDIELIIIQPRSPEGDPVKRHVMQIGELLEWKERFADGVERCDDLIPEYKAGDHCKFCPAKSVCPEISDRALKQAKADFSPVKSDGPKILKTPSISQIRNEDLPEILDAIPKLNTWISAIEQHAFEQMMNGVRIASYKLVEKKSTRKWASDVTEMALEKFGGEVMTKPELKSPAQFEKLGKAAKEFVNENVVSVSSGLTMVHESDPRPAVGRNTIEDDFSDNGVSEAEWKKPAKKGKKK